MQSHITRYVAIVAVFMHGLLCGHVSCCTISVTHDDIASVLHDHSSPACYCHSDETDHDDDGDISFGCTESSHHHCKHRHHSCPCVQSTTPNSGNGFRMVLNQNPYFLYVAFLPATTWNPSLVPDQCASKMGQETSAPEVRLHLLLEHFLI